MNTNFNQLESLYVEMDNTWNTIAEKYDFKCNGCKDNCCKSLFFHHTQIEKDYLLFGFSKLNETKQNQIKALSKIFYEQTFGKNGQKKEIVSQKIFCPVNEDEKCLLYKYRPMICRLHGLPHELKKPGVPGTDPINNQANGLVISPGCAAGQFDDKSYIQFDRTIFYQKMVQIEISYRQQFNKYSKIKETVAQMLL